ncbi:hypothetical protein I3760_01G058700 [Carya illinoinensis]|nr:hypothetical protein I3760_01G058700 [Carya illinoinensis]KAG2725287.1 hypothetical protein I3760_01G058700 [Carya illinoinensis]
MGDLYALDFDGVLCDSCGESSLSAVKAAKVKWPTLFDGVDSTTEDLIVDQMYIVRPVVETGYENLLLVRLLLEMRIPSIRKSSVSEGLTVEGILENWSKLKPVIMEEWDEKRDALVDLFGKVRDEWLEKDLTTWIGANRFYPGVPDALKFASSKLYIVTTKQSQGRSAEAASKETREPRIDSTLCGRSTSNPKECHQRARTRWMEFVSWGLGVQHSKRER